MTDMLITGARVVTDRGIVETDVAVRRGKIRLATSGSTGKARRPFDRLMAPSNVEGQTAQPWHQRQGYFASGTSVRNGEAGRPSVL
mgnify:CR=1 FL=1